MWAAALFIVSGIAIFALAGAVYQSRPSHPLNRRLAWVLAWGAFIQAIGLGVRTVVTDPAAGHALGMVYFVSIQLAPFVYARFIATMPSPLVRWLRPWYIQGLFLLSPALFLGRMWSGKSEIVMGPFLTQPGFSVTWDAASHNVLIMNQMIPNLFVFLVATIATLQLYLTNRGMLRKQWGFFTTGFVAYNAIFIGFMATMLLLAGPAGWTETTRSGEIFTMLAPALALYTLCGFLAYGVLQMQVFDIHLRIQWAAARLLLAATFVMVFLIVGTIATEYLLDAYGYLAGGIAAGLLLFAIGPIQRAAETIASKALHTSRKKADLHVRREEVYQAALEAAQLDGVVSPKEKDVLATLAHSLQLAALEVRDIERRVESAMAI